MRRQELYRKQKLEMGPLKYWGYYKHLGTLIEILHNQLEELLNPKLTPEQFEQMARNAYHTLERVWWAERDLYVSLCALKPLVEVAVYGRELVPTKEALDEITRLGQEMGGYDEEV